MRASNIASYGGVHRRAPVAIANCQEAASVRARESKSRSLSLSPSLFPSPYLIKLPVCLNEWHFVRWVPRGFQSIPLGMDFVGAHSFGERV